MTHLSPHLSTERLAGRPVRDRDAPFVAGLFGRASVGLWAAETEAPWSPEIARLRALGFAGHWAAHDFGLRLWEREGRPIGLAGLHFCVLEGAPAIEASFAFLPETWGQGLATEAMRAALAEAPGLCAEVQAVVREGNGAAVKVLTKLGFRERATALPDRRRFRWGEP